MELWTPTPGMSPIAFEGALEFRDMFIPAPGKDEWGVDTLDRVVRGPASRFEQFLATLEKGMVCDARVTNARYFYLQTWKPIDHHCFPGVSLSYKGFIGDAIPDDLPSTTRSELVSSVSASNLSITTGSEDNERTIIGGTRDIKYISPTTVWRYISRGEPTKKKYGNAGSVRGALGIENLGSRIVANYEDGGSESFGGNAPAGLVTALFVSPYIFVIGPSFQPIQGTPFYECEEVCQLKYPDN